MEKLTDEQKAVVSAIQRAITVLNAEMNMAADVGLEIYIDTLDVSRVSDRVMRRRVTAKVRQEDIPIA